MIKHIDSTQQPLGGLHIICLSLLIFLTSSSHAMAATDDPDEDPYSDNDINVQHHGDTMVMTVIAWSVMVITLEVNDFRHRLAVSYDKDDDDDNSNNNNILLSQNNITSSMQKSNRYIGALVAIRYGLIDGIIDWSIMYSIGYAIVAGCTWTNAEPESVVVIQGFSNILSAAILGVASFKLPEWVSIVVLLFVYGEYYFLCYIMKTNNICFLLSLLIMMPIPSPAYHHSRHSLGYTTDQKVEH